MLNGNDRSTLIKYFLIVLGGILAVFGLVLFIVIMLNQGKGSGIDPGEVATPLPYQTNAQNQGGNQDGQSQTSGSGGDFFDQYFAPPERTNILLMGTDVNGLLTDVMLLATFNAKTSKVDIVSLPRDTLVSLPQTEIDAAKALGRFMPSSGSMKLNEVHSYTGSNNGPDFLRRHVERMLDVRVDYFVRMDLRAFRNVVDAVGGIYMDVPKGGLYYKDPEQDLNIAVPAGRQLLDGGLAEGVVRFRNTYARGDLDRIEVQKIFMKEFFSQVLNKEALMKDVPALVSTFISYVTTDFSITNIPRYLNSIEKMKSDSISFHTLPGEDKFVNGGSYFFPDTAEIKLLVDEIFKEAPEEQEKPVESPKVSDDKTLRIAVLNGGNKSGFAAQTRDRLREAGFTVVKADNFEDQKQVRTRLLVKSEGMGEELAKLFKNPEIIVDKSIDEAYDIIVIIGTEE